jgi:Ca2+-binding RTX toxin-like protein
VTFHLYQINEVYSNADGTVQFIELIGSANNQQFFSDPDAILTVTQGGTTRSFHTTSDLGSPLTSGKTVLFATPGFQALTGVAPDYEIPVGFLFTSGSQTLHWGVDTLTIPVLPIDGGVSVGPNGMPNAGANSPKNFAGASGTVPANHAPVSADLLGDTFAGVGQLFSLTVPANDFSDADDDPLTFAATLANGSPLPAWLTFDDETLVLSGTPTLGDLGTIQIRITASDTMPASGSDTFALTVLDAFVVNGDGAGNNLPGTADDDIISGFGGDDTLDGGAGNDVLVGGPGNDSYVIADGDTVTEASGGGTDTVLASVSYTLGANVEKLTLTGGASIDGTGNDLANAITGNSGNNRLDGAGANDTLAGGAGNDIYVVAAGDVVVEALGEGHDTVLASVAVTLGDNVEDLALASDAHVTRGTGNALDNALTGNTLPDLLIGGAGNDTLSGGGGDDLLAGGPGNDLFLVDSLGDRVADGAGGHDMVISSVSFDLFSAGGIESLVLTGNATRGTGDALGNEIIGNASRNALDGRAGDDTLQGGAGNDTLTGGAGADTFFFSSLQGVDRVRDFQSGTDQLLFDGAAFAALDPESPFEALSYHDETGALFYDGQLIAVLEHAPSLQASDIAVIV